MRRTGIATAAAAISLLTLVVARYAIGRPVQRPEQQAPTFRAAANLVRLDVYPTSAGKPVPNLNATDFEVLEDGVPQKLTSFEHVVVGPGAAGEERVEPHGVDDAKRMAADARNRVFVLFLDTYHVTDGSAWHGGRFRNRGSAREPLPKTQKSIIDPRGIEKALVDFVNRTMAPTDLLAVITPEMDVSQLTFSRRSEQLDELLHTAWARRFSWDDLDPEEERWFLSYPPDTDCPVHCFSGVAEEMVLRRREQLSLDTLKRTVAELRTVREERKAIVLVTEGWTMFRPNPQLARPLAAGCLIGCPPQIPGGKQVRVGLDGKLEVGPDPRSSSSTDRQASDVARLTLSNFDAQLIFRQVITDANRSNASFYPVDPRGLAVFETPMDAGRPDGATLQPNAVEDINGLRARQEPLRDLASRTDGRAMLTSNDLKASLRKIADDLSDYYLLGYYSTNDKLDGRFRKISVRVKRPDVAVRARQGYWAATEAEIAARAKVERRVEPDTVARESALATLNAFRTDRPFRVVAGWAHGVNAKPLGWVVGEVDSSAARQAPWNSEADVTVTVSQPDGPVFATQHATLAGNQPRFAVRFDGETFAAGEYVIRVRATTKSGKGAEAAESVRVAVPDTQRALLLSDSALLFRRGPFSGPGFQPTADLRFRRSERLRVDVSLAAPAESLRARLLDRNGQPLSIPMAAAPREEGGVWFASCELTLAPLAQGDYLVEVSAAKDGKMLKTVIGFRVVP
jgi:VWFA-related protein